MPRSTSQHPDHPTCRPLSLLLACLGFLVLAAIPSSAAVFTVGSDAACDFSTINEALLAAGLNDVSGRSTDTIRVANNQAYYGENLVIGHSVVIAGGYSSCASRVPSGLSTLHATVDERALTLKSPEEGGRYTVHLLNLEFAGVGESTVENGGLLYAEGEAWVRIVDSIFSEGHAGEGGAIFLENGASTTIYNSTLKTNRATRGGAIGCVGGGRAHLLNGTRVETNAADLGGGVYLDDCRFEMRDDGDFLDEAYLGNNEAIDGGAVYSSGGSLRLEEAVIERNRAQRGAGLFLTGRLLARVGMVRVFDNVADQYGGAFFMEDLAAVDMERSYGLGGCPQNVAPSPCGRFRGNIASGGGAVFFLQTGAEAFISHARFNGNGADDGAIALVRDDASLRIDSCLLRNNAGDSMFYTQDTARIMLDYVTAADNRPWNEPEWVLLNNTGTGTSQNTKIIVYDEDGRPSPAFADNPADEWACLLIDDGSKDPGGPAILVGDPEWMNPAANDFRLRDTSPAIDVCDNRGLWTPADRRGHPRGRDMPWKANVLGNGDLGAYAYADLF